MNQKRRHRKSRRSISVRVSAILRRLSQIEWTTWLVVATWMVIVFAAGVIIWALPMRELAVLIQRVSERLGPLGFAAYVIAFVLLGLFCLPVWPMPFVAGALFGSLWGGILASATCTLTATICFLLSRVMRETWLRDWLESSPRVRAMEKVIESSNWKAVAAVRLSHLLTFGMQNYAFGLTKVRFWPYVITTWLITLPGNVMQAYLGSTGLTGLEALTEESFDWKHWLLRIAGLLVMIGAVVFLGYRFQKSYREGIVKTFGKAMKAESRKSQKTGKGQLERRFALLALAGLLVMIAVGSVFYRETLRDAIKEVSVHEKDRHGFNSSHAEMVCHPVVCGWQVS